MFTLCVLHGITTTCIINHIYADDIMLEDVVESTQEGSFIYILTI